MKWQACSAQVSTGKAAVHLWQVDLDLTRRQISQLQESLSIEETIRAGRFQFERDRRRYEAVHGVLRIIMSRYLGCAPAQVHYQVTSKGKPFLANSSELYFNLSHSHERALVAITNSHPIGVDIEQIRPLDDLNALARQCFSAYEYQQFAALPAPDNLQGFFNAWTRKEAFIKAIGDGLSYPLANFDVSLLPGEPARLLAIASAPHEASEWTLQAVNAGAGYAAAFAVRATEVTVQYLDWISLHDTSQLIHFI